MATKTEKNKVHQQYYSKSGTLLPGVTTVLNLLNKPALVAWAWKLGKQGIDYRKESKQATDIGSIAHYLILCDLSGITPDLGDYSQNDIDKAQNSIKSYQAWHRMNDIKPVDIECSLVSEKWGYGGTFDLLAEVNGITTIIDFKTSAALYSEYSYQIAAYWELLRENRGINATGKLIRINKKSNDDFEVKTVENIEKHFELFRHLLCVYNLQKELD